MREKYGHIEKKRERKRGSWNYREGWFHRGPAHEKLNVTKFRTNILIVSGSDPNFIPEEEAI